MWFTNEAPLNSNRIDKVRHSRAGKAIDQKGRWFSVAKAVSDLTEDRNEREKPHDFWSEWQNSNLRPQVANEMINKNNEFLS
jgi:hypothetical protein